jgi:hypothetical protein
MIKSPGARRYFNDNVLTFVIGVCGICYERDVRILVRCIFCFAIAGFRSARFYKRDVTNNCCGFVVIKSGTIRESFQCDARIDCARRLGAIFKRIECVFLRATFRATMYSAWSGVYQRGEKQWEDCNRCSHFRASVRPHSYHFVIAVWNAIPQDKVLVRFKYVLPRREYFPAHYIFYLDSRNEMGAGFQDTFAPTETLPGAHRKVI